MQASQFSPSQPPAQPHRGAFLNIPITLDRLAFPVLMDVLFVVVTLVLYGVTHWLASAVARLGGIE